VCVGGGGGVLSCLIYIVDDVIDVRRLPKPVNECHVETRDQASRESFDFCYRFPIYMVETCFGLEI
jgi:hypothetical protein